MKKLITILLVAFILCGCDINKKEASGEEQYLDLIETLNERTVFASTSNSFSITTDIAKTNEAYRYYVTIDNPKNAMYGVKVIAIEKGINYVENMAANVGIFSDEEYNMLPGQTDVSKGYVSGLTVSGISKIDQPTLYVLVEWYSKKQEIHQEFIQLDVVYEAE